MSEGRFLNIWGERSGGVYSQKHRRGTVWVSPPERDFEPALQPFRPGPRSLWPSPCISFSLFPAHLFLSPLAEPSTSGLSPGTVRAPAWWLPLHLHLQCPVRSSREPHHIPARRAPLLSASYRRGCWGSERGSQFFPAYLLLAQGPGSWEGSLENPRT